jgi:hypothetical protein
LAYGFVAIFLQPTMNIYCTKIDNQNNMKICDFEGCNAEAAEVVEVQNANGYFIMNMCPSLSLL